MPPDSTTKPTAHRQCGAAEPIVGPPEEAAREGIGTAASAACPRSGRPSRSARLHELVLEARVAALEQQLEHKERQLTEIRSQYEAVLDRRTGTGRPDTDGGFSWAPWD